MTDAPTTTAEWLSLDNPHNVESFDDYRNNLIEAGNDIKQFFDTVPAELFEQFKSDFKALIDKLERV